MIATVRIPKDNQLEDQNSTPKGDDNNRLLSVVNSAPFNTGSVVSAGSNGYLPKAKMSNASSALND